MIQMHHVEEPPPPPAAAEVPDLASAPFWNLPSARVPTRHLDQNAGKEGRRRRKLVWTSHKFNYSAHTQERLVC